MLGVVITSGLCYRGDVELGADWVVVEAKEMWLRGQGDVLEWNPPQTIHLPRERVEQVETGPT